MSSDIQASLAWEKNFLKPDNSKLLNYVLCINYGPDPRLKQYLIWDFEIWHRRANYIWLWRNGNPVKMQSIQFYKGQNHNGTA